MVHTKVFEWIYTREYELVYVCVCVCQSWIRIEVTIDVIKRRQPKKKRIRQWAKIGELVSSSICIYEYRRIEAWNVRSMYGRRSVRERKATILNERIERMKAKQSSNGFVELTTLSVAKAWNMKCSSLCALLLSLSLSLFPFPSQVWAPLL